MKLFKTLLTILFISLLSSPSWSATIDDLVQREGIYYEKFTDVPFNGKLIGGIQGSFKNGKREGAWVWYYSNGQVMSKSFLKNGLAQGTGVTYYRNGQLHNKVNYKNDKKEGDFVWYYEDGTVVKENTGIFKDGVKISD